MKASELDKKFDDNQEDILDYFDTSKIKIINEEPKRVIFFKYGHSRKSVSKKSLV